uniref:Secreted protein n=1 Tax=Ditylenchus dipsaci TaxID=166011 RepID=A0A915CUP0_9BILA
MLLLLPIAFVSLIKNALCLECIQCDRQGVWYSPEENERHILRCQTGMIPATRCSNTSHTHCIFNYYKKAGTVTVTERRCGMAEEMSGCTLYKSMAGGRAKRHLIGGSNVDRPMPSSHRRREASLLVEVCTSGCTKDAASVAQQHLHHICLGCYY